jgi:hypothetical protein
MNLQKTPSVCITSYNVSFPLAPHANCENYCELGAHLQHCGFFFNTYQSVFNKVNAKNIKRS